jgi:hypothetical protein
LSIVSTAADASSAAADRAFGMLGAGASQLAFQQPIEAHVVGFDKLRNMVVPET